MLNEGQLSCQDSHTGSQNLHKSTILLGGKKEGLLCIWHPGVIVFVQIMAQRENVSQVGARRTMRRHRCPLPLKTQLHVRTQLFYIPLYLCWVCYAQRYGNLLLGLLPITRASFLAHLTSGVYESQIYPDCKSSSRYLAISFPSFPSPLHAKLRAHWHVQPLSDFAILCTGIGYYFLLFFFAHRFIDTKMRYKLIVHFAGHDLKSRLAVSLIDVAQRDIWA